MQLLFYDDPPLDDARAASPTSPTSLFLAGPTAHRASRTPWRHAALELLSRHGYHGTVVIPEFRDGDFAAHAPRRFGDVTSAAPAMRGVSYGILAWETAGIERATVALFWMPFALAAEDDPASLPGFTTRAEVSRELARAPDRLVLGMPAGALSSAHIRFHAHHASVPIHDTLEATVAAALAGLGALGDTQPDDGPADGP